MKIIVRYRCSRHKENRSSKRSVMMSAKPGEGKSGRGLPHSNTLREGRVRWRVRQLLECGSPLPLLKFA
jgi:hypothetical protein